MDSLRRFLLCAAWLLVAVPARAADPMHFLFIQPGSPGSSDDAAPLIGRFADYLTAHLGQGAALSGSYLNSIEAVKPAIGTSHPRFAIVTLPYYLEQRAAHDWRPQLASRPGGRTEDHYRLLVSTANPVAGWETLTGDVAGTLCHTPEGVARLMFDRPAAALPFHCRPTDRLLRAARQVVRGELNGLLVTDEQHASLKALPEGASLKALHATGPLPPPLVVTFGPPDGALHGVIQTLLGMKDDPTARELLTELRTDGFQPIDQNGLTALQSRFDQAGKP